jgi:hypothetical protein
MADTKNRGGKKKGNESRVNPSKSAKESETIARSVEIR